ncbi:MAG: DNA translocase FtsK [Phycisphaerae bacterium]|nr:DNA translocase FtsK [Phycisphaerae bacterium]
MKHGYLYKVAIEGGLLCVCVLLLCSVLSFDMGDAPSEYVWPHNEPTANWVGRIGAVPAYYLLYYAGPGIVIGLFGLIACLFLHLSGKGLSQPVLRAIGLVLVTAAVSTSWYLLWPNSENGGHLYRLMLGHIYSSGDFPWGNGGILGVAAGTFLPIHVSQLGTWVIVFFSFIVGATVAADTVVLTLARWFGMGVLKLFGLAGPALSAAKEQSQALGEIWTRLSQKQKAEEKTFAEAMRRYREKIAQPPTTEAKRPVPASAAEPTAAAAPKVKPTAIATPPAASKPKHKPASVPQKSYEDYEFPPLDLLKEPEKGFSAIQERMVEEKAKILEALLDEFGIQAQVVNAEAGPAITMYELELAAGVKVSQISTLANDIARAVSSSSGSVRVVAPLAGKHTIGIEVPNSERETVRLKELLVRGEAAKMQIPLYLGKSSSGEILVSDLAAMPHLLIAGTTGSGKSVCINSILISILLTRRPDEVKMILIDPKMVEMAAFESIPHSMCPTITDMNKAEQILQWATEKMDERYELLAEAKVRNIASYNLLTQEELIERFNPTSPEEEAKIPKKLPHIVIVIDELADLMMTAAKEIEAYIVRIAQKSRAVGIHLVLATQRPQATVVTGLIKSNMPSRIAFRVAGRMDSRIILDQNGAETLLGQGDMLFLKPGTSELVRSQGAFLDDEEIRGVVNFLKDVAQPQYHPELMQLNTIDLGGTQKDDMFDEAVRVVLESKRGSVSLLQRRLSIGYARASRIIEMMAAAGILGEYKGSQAREVTMTLDDYEAMRKNMVADEVAGYADLTNERGDDDAYDSPVEEVEEDDNTEDDNEK